MNSGCGQTPKTVSPRLILWGHPGLLQSLPPNEVRQLTGVLVIIVACLRVTSSRGFVSPAVFNGRVCANVTGLEGGADGRAAEATTYLPLQQRPRQISLRLLSLLRVSREYASYEPPGVPVFPHPRVPCVCGPKTVSSNALESSRIYRVSIGFSTRLVPCQQRCPY